MRPRQIKRSFNCQCGASISVSGPVAMVDGLLADFTALHQRPGCGRTTAKAASRARNKAKGTIVCE